jgi:hypothetical protein
MFLLIHQHLPQECRYAFAAWRGFASSLRDGRVLSSCLAGAHRLCWTVDAPDATAALALLPPYVADRAEADPVREVTVP